MSLEEIKKHFIEQIKLRAFDDKFIDKKEEKEILSIAIDQGITVESARKALVQVAEHLEYIVESKLDEYAKERFEAAIQKNKGVTKEAYLKIAKELSSMSNGILTNAKIREKLRSIIKDNAFAIKEGMMQGGNWYSKG